MSPNSELSWTCSYICRNSSCYEEDSGAPNFTQMHPTRHQSCACSRVGAGVCRAPARGLQVARRLDAEGSIKPRQKLNCCGAVPASALHRLKCGTCGSQAYVAWNVHEPYPGDFRWDGWQDVEGFIKLAQKLDFMVVLRPGPYICAEWDFGGFPWWLGSKQARFTTQMLPCLCA